jgi:hypothetical protein
MLCLVPKSLAQTVEDDVLLVEIVSQQSRDLYANDTLPVGDSAIVLSDTLWQYYPHPLCIP